MSLEMGREGGIILQTFLQKNQHVFPFATSSRSYVTFVAVQRPPAFLSELQF